MDEIKRVRIDFHQLEKAQNIEEVLCLATLIAIKELDAKSNTDDAKIYWDNLDTGCSDCAFQYICLACIINE